MRSSTTITTLVTFVLCLLLVTGVVAEEQKRSVPEESYEELLALALKGQLDSERLLSLEKRQAAAGGGGGVATTYTGVQTISGYTPPPSTRIPTPTPSAGTIVSASDIPGYGNSSSNSAATLQGPSSSSMLTLFTTAFAVAMAAGAGWAFL
ncbi:hypothetical protein ACQY0O_001831 [Thecaphora frezii]